LGVCVQFAVHRIANATSLFRDVAKPVGNMASYRKSYLVASSESIKHVK
jgi:hypothetical protein